MDQRRTGAQVLVDQLAAGGVSHVFGIPGEHCLGIVDAIDRHPGMRFVSVRHESAAAFMAEAYGKFAGVPAACLGTASVGAANLVAGVNVAQHDSTPMVTVVGQVETGLRGRGAWQDLDLVSVFEPMCGYATEVGCAGRLPDAVARALAVAVSGRPGPVLLSVPVDVQDRLCAVRRTGAGAGPVVPPAPAAPPEQVTQLAGLIGAASRPLVVAGGGIRAAGAGEELVRLADEVGLPVATAFRRTDAFPNDHPGYVGPLGLATPAEVRETVLGADLLIAVGTRLSEVTTMRYAFPGPTQRLVHIDVAGGAGDWPPAALRIRADARRALAALRRECGRVSVQGPPPWWSSHRQARGARLARARTADPFTRLTAEVADRIDALLPDDAVVCSDAGDFFIAAGALVDFAGNRRFLGPTSGTMGYGLPAAIAAKLADPRRPAVALCGDGGALMSIQELETAVRYRVPVIAVVFNNRAYGSIVRHQRSRYGGRSVGSRLGDLNFARLAEGFGAAGYRAGAPEEFAASFAAALAADRPCLIEVN